MTEKKGVLQKVLDTTAKLATTDGWGNLISGLGQTANDKRLGGFVKPPKRLEDIHLEYLFDGDDLARRIVRKPVLTMMRGGWELTGFDSDVNSKIDAEVRRLEVHRVLREALMWSDLYGGSVILKGADDGVKDLTKPLRSESVKEVRFLKAVPRPWVNPNKIDTDPRSPNSGEPLTYNVQVATGASVIEVHHSRLIVFRGDEVTVTRRRELNGWGQSVLVPMYDVLRDFIAAYDGAFVLSTDFSQAVFGMTGLADALSSKNGDLVKDRLMMMDLARSIVNAVVVDNDSGETFERKTTNISGLPELLDRLGLRLCLAVDMPATVLFGRSPAGENATGESDLENWYARVDEARNEKMTPALEQIYACVFTSLQIEPPEGWGIKYAPLWQMSALERAQLHQTQAVADQTYLTLGVLSSEEVRQSRFGGDEYSTETELAEGVDAQGLSVQLAELRAANAGLNGGDNGDDPEGTDRDSGSHTPEE